MTLCNLLHGKLKLTLTYLVVVVVQKDLPLSHQVNPLMEVSAVELAAEQAVELHVAPFLGVVQQTQVQMIHYFDFQCEVFLL